MHDFIMDRVQGFFFIFHIDDCVVFMATVIAIAKNEILIMYVSKQPGHVAQFIHLVNRWQMFESQADPPIMPFICEKM